MARKGAQPAKELGLPQGIKLADVLMTPTLCQLAHVRPLEVTQSSKSCRFRGLTRPARKLPHSQTDSCAVVRGTAGRFIVEAPQRIDQPMKKNTLCGLLSLIVPGAGLLYCGYPRLAAANFAAAIIIPLAAIEFGFPAEHILWVFLGLATGSAGLAHSMATSNE